MADELPRGIPSDMGFEVVATQNIDNAVVFTYLTSDVPTRTECLFVKVVEPSSKAVKTYVHYHNQFFHARKDATVPVVLVYDLRESGTPSMEFVSTVVEMHKPLKNVYEKVLLCSVVFVTSEVIERLINGMFGALYTPTKPVRVITKEADMTEFVDRIRHHEEVPKYSTVSSNLMT